ncbi:class I SAM-dependent DNA methyltransferase [Actinoplanes sp. TRM 88003]|uniref:site-specific DNA-methyltransferase (adenine-specific) n=1 Tax=Paractinoplanes aksuensis TaxID=2939490 RepID=A0ABT1DLU4_9ACTN|nr:DNA methyltransferase [Actinoplanes aksuensis]MCO8271802.1 class I SAM-dependent DNA methyltransferase [Actinoplanes aksuensis]
MNLESLTNRGEYLSAHYLAEVLPTAIKGTLLKRWAEEEKADRETPRAALRKRRRAYLDAKAELSDQEFFDPERLRKHNLEMLRAFGYDPQPQTLTVERAGQEYEIPVAHAETSTGHGIVALHCGWAVDADAAQDATDAGRLIDEVSLGSNEKIQTGAKLASWLFAAPNPPRYVLLLNGGVVTLADKTVWGEGRYLSVSLDLAYGRNDDKELDVIAALFGADSLRPPAEGGTEELAELVNGSRQHAVGVSSDLREGLRVSVELIANEVLDQIRAAGHQPQDVMELDALAKELGRESLRYLYRILFLLYAEARPELGVLPVKDPEYVEGYSLDRLGDLISRRLAPSAEGGYHLYESLDLLFKMVNEGHRPRGGAETGEKASEGVGLRFEPMKSDLFLPEFTKLIGRLIPLPGSDPDDENGPKLDTRLRNATLYQVLRRLMLSKGSRKGRGGFISYAQLGINQLGAVYEGLMSYTGFVATETLYEVAKGGDPKDGSWMIPASKVDEYDDSVFVEKENAYTGVRSRVTYKPGQFVYRLAGRDRQTSASYYTPQSLTKVTVQLALKYRLEEEEGEKTPARKLLDWTICEPALGSGAFLNEAINQVAAKYLQLRQKELKVSLDPEQYHEELQKVKAYIALHNCYGVDLNRTAVELAEVSLWLNVMHAGLQAPWFGLHLQRGNSLIGGGRRLYTAAQLADKSWLTTAPQDKPFRDGPIDEGTIHHFLLPADGWGAVAGEKEARELAPDETERLKKWRTAMKRVPSTKGSRGKPSQVARLQALSRRVEFLWDLVQQRLKISEQEIRRDIKVWGAEDLPPVNDAVPREKIMKDLTEPGTPYWRLKILMDTWCALWFWPLDKVGLLDGSDPEKYPSNPVEVTYVREEPEFEEPASYEIADIFGQVQPQQTKLPTKATGGTRKMTFAHELSKQVPLASLEDWLTFTEAVVGRRDLDDDAQHFYGRSFASLEEMSEFEERLEPLIGVDSVWTLGERFPWLQVAEQTAEDQGFFHWELCFASVFAKGGFEMQVGNPPWVRPRWEDSVALAEVEPWFKLSHKPDVDLWRFRKSAALAASVVRRRYINDLTGKVGLAEFLSVGVNYPLLAGTQPDLYRAFMCQVWLHLGQAGTAGVVHPDSHFGGIKEGDLRASSYRRLRLHAAFVNAANWAFSDAGRTLDFGVHIYGVPKKIGFLHLSQLYGANVLIDSLDHDGQGAIPGQKYKGAWDLRPHRSRLVFVDEELLDVWRGVGSDLSSDLDQSPLLHPITTQEQGAIAALAVATPRLGDLDPFVTRGYREKEGKDLGLIRYEVGRPKSLADVILQGSHLSIATPHAKEPNDPFRNGKDWASVDLTTLDNDYVPRTTYEIAGNEASSRSRQDLWGGRRYTEYYRLAWRQMIDPKSTERSLFAAIISPGPAHTHAVRSSAFATTRETALNAGFWSSLPLDYVLRIAGQTNLDIAGASIMPAASLDHPLSESLLLRVLRLNCLTEAYAALWEELYRRSWVKDDWVVGWGAVHPLGQVQDSWDKSVALRTEFERRAALVEIDALVSVWLGISADELIAILRSRYPILDDREMQMWFDARGRRISADPYAFGYRQEKGDYEQLVAHLLDPDSVSPPVEYLRPFYKASRELEYVEAHAAFSERLRDAIDAGWQAS